MSEITEKDKERIRNYEPASVLIPPEFFEEGDYTDWQENSEETKDMSYEEFQAYLVDHMKEYDSIVMYSDGTIYGNKGGMSHDIDYDNFGRDREIFIELAEKYGIGEVDFT